MREQGQGGEVGKWKEKDSEIQARVEHGERQRIRKTPE